MNESLEFFCLFLTEDFNMKQFYLAFLFKNDNPFCPKMFLKKGPTFAGPFSLPYNNKAAAIQVKFSADALYYLETTLHDY